MDIRHLTLFYAVAEEQQFSRAAERLDVAASTVSFHIGRLEQDLGVALFERTTRKITLTPAGALLHVHAAAILDAHQHAVDAIGAFRYRLVRTVRLGVSTELAGRLDDVAAAFMGREPDGELVITTGHRADRVRQVQAGQLDATILRRGEMGSHLQLIKLWSDPVLAAVSAGGPWDGEGPLDLAELAGAELVLAGADDLRFLHTLMISSCAAAGFSPTFGPEHPTTDEALSAVASGATPAWTVLDADRARSRDTPGIVWRRLQDPDVATPAFLAVRRQELSPGLDALIAACRSSRSAEEHPGHVVE